MTSLSIVPATEALARRHAPEIAALAHATGPVSYDYHFENRSVFDCMVRRSWLTSGTLFGWDGTHLALEGDELLGIEIGYEGTGYRDRQAALAPLWSDMLSAQEVTEAEIEQVLRRSDLASWLNPVLRPGVYYVHALSVKPEHRGRQIGAALLNRAIDDARKRGFKRLELDVLSDNPAVNFYQSMGLSLMVASRAPDPEAHGVPVEWRMGMSLETTTSAGQSSG